jgi:hypothetical protein
LGTKTRAGRLENCAFFPDKKYLGEVGTKKNMTPEEIRLLKRSQIVQKDALKLFQE